MFDLNFFLKSLLILPLFSISYIGISMVKDYVEVSYFESEKNKKID